MVTILAAAALAAIELGPCELRGLAAECGTIAVAENRSQPDGRKIDLRVALVRHAPDERSRDAIFVLAGGPGQGATALASYAARIFAGAGRDIVLVDMRGTGGSSPLRCELGGSDQDVQGYLTDFLPLDRVAACRASLETRADLTQYTTAAAADDLEEVRRRLGYAQVNLYGTSYGTRLAQEFMRRHPRSVRMAILDGVVSPSLIAPATYARDAQRSLERVFELCAADAACRAAYPALETDYRAMLERVAAGIEVTIDDPVTGKPVRLRINRGLFGEAFRNFLYSPERYALVPALVHRAARGDFSLLARTALDYGRAIRTLDFGLFLSVTCTEDVPRIDVEAARREAEGTLLGAYRVEQQVAACRIWPRGAPDPAQTEPLPSSIPTLLLSGELDPVTPPRYADEVASTLGEAVHVVVPNGSHSGDTGGCLERIGVQAVRAGSVRDLDLACVGDIPAPRFSVETEQAPPEASRHAPRRE